MGTYPNTPLIALDRPSDRPSNAYLVASDPRPGRRPPHRSDAFPNVAGDRPGDGRLGGCGDSQKLGEPIPDHRVSEQPGQLHFCLIPAQFSDGIAFFLTLAIGLLRLDV